MQKFNIINIHFEPYPAGKLKYERIALIDKHIPVIVVAPNDNLEGHK